MALYATGNSLRVRGDMVRRALRATLDAKMERPETRRFDFEPLALVIVERGRYVAAALTIVRAYFASGEEMGLEPLQSFEDWTRAVRSPLVWLGCADPCETMEEVCAEDPVLGMLRQLLSAWRRTTTEPKTARELVEFATNYDTLKLSEDEMKRRDALRTALATVAPSARNGAPINEKLLGYKLRDLQDRIACCGELGNLRLEKEESRSGEGLTRWRVVATEEAEEQSP